MFIQLCPIRLNKEGKIRKSVIINSLRTPRSLRDTGY